MFPVAVDPAADGSEPTTLPVPSDAARPCDIAAPAAFDGAAAGVLVDPVPVVGDCIGWLPAATALPAASTVAAMIAAMAE
jgi:hypothetical protein